SLYYLRTKIETRILFIKLKKYQYKIKIKASQYIVFCSFIIILSFIYIIAVAPLIFAIENRKSFFSFVAFFVITITQNILNNSENKVFLIDNSQKIKQTVKKEQNMKKMKEQNTALKKKSVKKK
ncbi:hypothetical protein RFI_38919, partial [Reticulomyxa filosa]